MLSHFSDTQIGSLLLKACGIIGKLLDLSFKEPIQYESSSISDQVYEIAIASDVNYRPVRLMGHWWEKDQGPLLAFLSSNEPVVLLPTSTGYDLINPADETSKTVTQNVAKELNPEAFMFYRSLPIKPRVTDSEILKFAFHGKGKDLWTTFCFGFLGIFVSLFLPFAYKILFDQAIPYIDETLFSHILIGLVVMFASYFVFTLTKEYAVLRLETYINHDLESALWERFLNLSAHFFRRFNAGNLIQRIFSVGEIHKRISGHVLRTTLTAIFSLIYLLAMLYYSPILTLVGTGIVLLGLMITILGFLIAQRYEIYGQNLNGKLQGKVVEMLQGLSKIRTNGAENRVFAFWNGDNFRSQIVRKKIGNLSIATNVANDVIQVLKLLLIFIAVMSLLDTDLKSGKVFTITIGTYLAFTAAFFSFADAVFDFNKSLMELVPVYPIWRRSKVILNESPETSSERAKPGNLVGEVNIDHVYFRYDPNGLLIHSGISLQAKPGEFIGVVGSSGAGKSTLVRLLLGFEEPQQGAIYYDDKDLFHLDLHDVRRQLGIVLEDGAILEGTIRENVLGGNVANDEQVLRALQLAGFENDLKQLPEGLDTHLQFGGNTLSGGQKQCLLIARSFLKEPAIIIWDEATNALDNITEELVLKNLSKIKSTRIVFTHQLETVRNADRIYVLDKGKITKFGTYQQIV